jgi:MoxR-like ATPase
MFTGGIFFFDEIGKAPPAALNPLASVLDERRMLDSVLAGIRIEAHEGFLFCAALNEDEESGGRLPLFLEERLSPAIRVGIPPPATFRMILQKHLPPGDDRWIEIYMKEFWNPETTPREARTRLQFAYGMASRAGATRASNEEIREFLRRTEAKESETEALADGIRAKAVPGKKAVSQEKPDEIEHLLVLRKDGGGEITH